MAKIVIAEDEPDIRELIAFTLRFSGAEVVTTSNGIEALQAVCNYNPDLILLDVRMPKMTGYDACRVLKESTILKDIPVVFLSAKSTDTEIKIGLDAGAEEYLLKPFAPDQLVNRIKSVLEKFGKEIDYLSKKESKYEQENFDILMGRTWNNETWMLRKKNQELLRTIDEQKQIIQSKFSMAELSLLTGGVVHDLRNGLGILRNTIGFMEDNFVNSPYEKDILKLTRSLDFCERVLRNLSTIGGKEALYFEEIDLEKVILETSFMLESRLVDINVIVDSGDEKQIIRADEGNMKQVFMNLIKNASEAMPDGGTITCRLRTKSDIILVEIQDTGIGITEDNLKLLFHEFFTTKERGFGIGLRVVKSVVENHGGEISVVSEVGKGTTFSLRLPKEGPK